MLTIYRPNQPASPQRRRRRPNRVRRSRGRHRELSEGTGCQLLRHRKRNHYPTPLDQGENRLCVFSRVCDRDHGLQAGHHEPSRKPSLQCQQGSCQIHSRAPFVRFEGHNHLSTSPGTRLGVYRPSRRWPRKGEAGFRLGPGASSRIPRVEDGCRSILHHLPGQRGYGGH